MKNIIKSGFMLAAIVSAPSYAGYTFDLGDKDSITFGGFIKADIRTVSGDVSAPATGNDYWIGAASVTDDISTTKFTANETRFNAKYVHGDVTGFIELDFYGGGGNQIISNSSHPRLRHAFIKYKNITVGQTWTTFMNTSAIPESADFGGPLVAESFIRQGQIRYTNGGLQVSLENPYSDKGDNTQDSIPDFIAKYTFKGDWGNVSVSGVARQLNTVGGDTVSAAGFGVAGRIKTFGKDDFRFQVHGGKTGRYVSVVTARDLVGEEAEQSTSIMAAYRHYWTEDMRSTVYYGTTDTDLGNVKNNHVAVNLFKNYTKQLSFGVEVGNFEMSKVNKNSNYLQFSAKYVL